MTKVLVTGAGGFVGRALLERLRGEPGLTLCAALRQPAAHIASDVQTCIVDDVLDDWRELLAGVDVVVHCAGRAHIMHEASADPLAEFRRVNVQGSLHLASQAAAAGVRRFVFLSSIKVNGETTAPEMAYTAHDRPAPADPYGVSKWEAEQRLAQLARETAIELVVLRPVLVYGPGVKANFRSLLACLSKRIPLPLGAIDNRRSLVALGNLTDLIRVCITHPAAANRTLLVSDGEDLSTTQLLERLGAAMERPARLIPVPAAWLLTGARLLRREAMAQRLCGSLQVDIAETQRLLGWTPPLSVDAALEQTARAFLAGQRP